jgi:hypothetical protein
VQFVLNRILCFSTVRLDVPAKSLQSAATQTTGESLDGPASLEGYFIENCNLVQLEAPPRGAAVFPDMLNRVGFEYSNNVCVANTPVQRNLGPAFARCTRDHAHHVPLVVALNVL